MKWIIIVLVPTQRSMLVSKLEKCTVNVESQYQFSLAALFKTMLHIQPILLKIQMLSNRSSYLSNLDYTATLSSIRGSNQSQVGPRWKVFMVLRLKKIKIKRCTLENECIYVPQTMYPNYKHLAVQWLHLNFHLLNIPFNKRFMDVEPAPLWT